ncbi:hypothetical protein AnigIFM60653_006279 [Aspergillus niger]|nr:hypothetical protein AnigIFM60653_006279 [Aspergillus niger]
MAWELKEPDEYQSSYLFKWGSKIAKLLDHVKVPYVAWGDLMNSHMIRDSDTNWGCLSWYGHLGFVVSDDRFDAAIRALRVAGLSEDSCYPEYCHWANGPESCRLPYPWPAHHFHHYVGDVKWVRGKQIKCYPVGLYRKSQWLWLLPDLPLDFPEPNDPNFMLSTDRRLPDWDVEGFGNSFHPIKLLTPVRWIESLICQTIRDLSLKGNRGRARHIPVEEFHQRLARQLPPELFHLDLLQQPFRTIYKLSTVGDFGMYPLLWLCLDRIWEEWQETGSMPDPVLPFNNQKKRRRIEEYRSQHGFSRNKVSEMLRNGI